MFLDFHDCTLGEISLEEVISSDWYNTAMFHEP